MPPLPPDADPLPRLVIYYQTLHDASEKLISALPLIIQPEISLTHLILAAIHINEDPDALTLNDHVPSHPRYQTLWAELRVLQASGVKVMGMLGGAAKGSYYRLDGDEAKFEKYYGPLKKMIRDRSLDGLDLDVEENMSLGGIIRLIDRLRSDFGKDFIITLAPVATALLRSDQNLSGFDYEALEVMRGREISWYNAQFYNGWGDFSGPLLYDLLVGKGWSPDRVVVGLVTTPANGGGFVPWNPLAEVLMTLRGRYDRFGGVMGWEYFNSLPGGTERPWEWARHMTKLLRGDIGRQSRPDAVVRSKQPTADNVDADDDETTPVQVPRDFEYYTDGSLESSP